jgi:hypothetical protein
VQLRATAWPSIGRRRGERRSTGGCQGARRSAVMAAAVRHGTAQAAVGSGRGKDGGVKAAYEL